MSGSLWTDYQRYLHKSRYARWLDKEGRRENWEETVTRYFDFFYFYLQDKGITVENWDIWDEAKKAVINLEVMPSMRALMTAGPALERDHVAGYNCSYLTMGRVRAFDELMYILMCGTGVGFSVERQYIAQLPVVAEEFYETDTTIVVHDSKIGWAKAFRELISLLYSGQVPKWDLTKLRPAGAKLKTFGGRSSGSGPLEELFSFTTQTFRKAAGRKLNSLEVHDIVCKVADIVVVGGVRRSALISLSNLTDDRMRVAKSGQWWESNPQRALANNSVAYTEKPDMHAFLKEWQSLYDSKSGERGIFSRVASQKQAGRNGRRDAEYDFGTNPCSEIILRDRQFCNLTEVVVRAEDTLDSLRTKVRLAAFLGTLQSMLTDFRYLSADWRKNCEEERLLGVSLTGIMDHPILGRNCSPVENINQWLEEMRGVAVDVNKQYAEKLNINVSSAITCVKPSGTVSQLVGSGSGIHPRYSRYYIRTVRNDVRDPLAQFLIASGVPYEPEQGKEGKSVVFSFPIKSPDNAVLRDEVTAIQQLELWKTYQEHWCEHKPSITVYVREHEWLEVGAWVYKHFDIVSGVSFLPYDDHVYKQAPYQPISEEKYLEMVAKFPVIGWANLEEYEQEDTVNLVHDLACSAGVCEI